MKGIIKLVDSSCALGVIKNGECFVWDDDCCETVFMKCKVEEKEVMYVDLTTGEIDYRSIYDKVTPVHAEFTARNLTLGEAEEYE